MSWIRIGDRAAYHPIVLDVVGDERADERSVNEVFGFITRWAFAEATYQTASEIVLTYTRAIPLAGWAAQADRLIGLAEFAGYIVEIETQSTHRMWILDCPEILTVTGTTDQ